VSAINRTREPGPRIISTRLICFPGYLPPFKKYHSGSSSPWSSASPEIPFRICRGSYNMTTHGISEIAFDSYIPFRTSASRRLYLLSRLRSVCSKPFQDHLKSFVTFMFTVMGKRPRGHLSGGADAGMVLFGVYGGRCLVEKRPIYMLITRLRCCEKLRTEKFDEKFIENLLQSLLRISCQYFSDFTANF